MIDRERERSFSTAPREQGGRAERERDKRKINNFLVFLFTTSLEGATTLLLFHGMRSWHTTTTTEDSTDRYVARRPTIFFWRERDTLPQV